MVVKQWLLNGQRADAWVPYVTKDGRTGRQVQEYAPLLVWAVRKGAVEQVRCILEAGRAYEPSWLNAFCTEFRGTALCWALEKTLPFHGTEKQVKGGRTRGASFFVLAGRCWRR